MREMETLAMMILDDIEELNRKLLTMKNTISSIDADTTNVNFMLFKVRALRTSAITNVDATKELRRERKLT